MEPNFSKSPVEALIRSYDWDAFRQGYGDFGGREDWLEHFVQDVLPCESTIWGGWYANGYVSRAQFHPDSWTTAVRNTGLVEPTDPYVVGGNVAWWSNAIDHPGSTAGWPTCWWMGTFHLIQRPVGEVQ